MDSNNPTYAGQAQDTVGVTLAKTKSRVNIYLTVFIGLVIFSVGVLFYYVLVY